MAKLIFNNQVNTEGTFMKIFANDAEVNMWMNGRISENYKVIDYSDSLENVILGKTLIRSFDSNNNITTVDVPEIAQNDEKITTSENYDNFVKRYLEQIDIAMLGWTNWPSKTEWQSYRTSIENMTKPSSFPMTVVFPDYVNSQGLTYKNSLQLP